MIPVSAISLGALALSAQLLSPVMAMEGATLQSYTEWRQSNYYTEAVKVAITYGGSATGSFSSTTKTGTSSSVSDVTSSSADSNATIATSSSSSSANVVGISETEEQDRFDQALAVIAELQELHPHANFSVNTPFVLLTSEEFLAYVNRYAVDPDSTPIKANSRGSTTTSSMDGGPLTTDAQGSNSSIASSQDGGVMTSSAASGETVDWEDAGCVTAVKDQGECGACWAFSATAAMESGYCVASGSLPSLSEQELISCDDDGDSNGCGGGYAAYTIDWVANDRGGKMCTLDSYPFASDDGSVPSCSMSSCTEVNIGVTGYESVREDAGALEDAVRNQPVSIFLYSGSSAFQYYTGGVLTGENCDKTGSHSALAVGFGETDDGVSYWRIKNQWGTSWGEDGYVRVERRYSGDSDGACGVELYATWPTFDTSSSLDATTSTPSTTTATPSSTTATPSVTTATGTATPSSTTATPTTPTATKPILGAVQNEDSGSGSTTEAPATTTATPTTETPTVTEAVQNQAADQTVSSGSSSDDESNYTIKTPSTTATPATTVQAEGVNQNEGSTSIAGEASYSRTPSPIRDCAM